MIATVHGKVTYKEKESLIIEIGGVGLEVLVPAQLREETARGESVSLHTYLVVRETELTLYGFETREEKEFFELMLGVSGVGPKIALSTISTLNPDAIRRAVFHEQPEVFSRVPGLGKKTAQSASASPRSHQSSGYACPDFCDDGCRHRSARSANILRIQCGRS
ncbi:MAG: Holliday junction branch migration protein RuvA, partial [Anaerolineae bacterium]|nr:Holliday junction branch migration protein RuvA [Anaerolineae bacterium]